MASLRRRGGHLSAAPTDGLQDEQAVGAACEAHGAEIYRFALRGLGDPGAAEDVVQETFLRAWRAMQAAVLRTEAAGFDVFDSDGRLVLSAELPA